MDRTKMAQKQMTLAKKAQADPGYRFPNLYSLMHWEYWIRCAADAVLARPGSATAGVDAQTRSKFKENYEAHITALVESLKRKTYQPQPVRRVFIPKRNGKRRPLGIATLKDRIVQEALRAILDPIYESDFRPHSFGFRKGRSTMDAIREMWPNFNAQAKYYYIIEGDLESYFDTIHHRKLLRILKRRIADRDLITLIWKFLKAGVMEDGIFRHNDSGVPQGAGISPLLANVYLNEFDKWAEQKWHLPKREQTARRRQDIGNYRMYRYADDFVVISNAGIADVRQAEEEMRTFLETELHLKLSSTKTKITHLNDGFDFLGFHIQRIKPEGRWVVYLRPTAQAQARIKARLKTLTSRNWTWMDEYTRLTTLNWIVRGWASYYRHTTLIRDIEAVTRYTGQRYLRWLRKKHKGARPGRLIQAKTKVIHKRKRWTAEIHEGNITLTTYQWHPTAEEFPRGKIRRKGKDGYPHPYLCPTERAAEDYPTGETGPAERIYTVTLGIDARGAPLEYAERKLRVKMRDGFRCRKCGSLANLQVDHTKGMKSHRPKHLQTLCRSCHYAVTRERRQQQTT